MITNLQGLTAYLVNWIGEQATESGTRNGCVGLSGGIDSAVVFALCCRAFPMTVGVMMPCQSSPESLSRAKEVLASQAALGYGVRGITVPLDTSFHSILDSVAKSLDGEVPGDAKANLGALRSCLRAPVLDYVSKCSNSLIYGTGNRDEDEVFRYYQKRGDGAVDNNPIVGLHKSEVRQLAKHLGLPQSVIDAVPTADLWGTDGDQTDEGELGLTYDEIEWVTRLNSTHYILEARDELDTDLEVDDHVYTDSSSAFRAEYADKFTERQFEIIEKAYHMEKASRHKAEPPPGPHRDDISIFVI